MFFVHVPIVDRRCPNCGAIVNDRPAGICSCLGPPRYRCSDCGLLYESGRLEWADMTWKRKAWYVGVSLFYTGAIGAMGGVSIASAVHSLRKGPWENDIPVGTLEQGLGTLVCAVLIGALQIGRVFRSLEQSREREHRKMELGSDSDQDVATGEESCQHVFWLGPAGLAFFLILAPGVLGWLVALFLS